MMGLLKWDILCLSILIMTVVTASVPETVESTSQVEEQSTQKNVEEVQNCWVAIDLKVTENSSTSKTSETLKPVNLTTPVKNTECVLLNDTVIGGNSVAYSVWRNGINSVMKVRLFNYTNWQNVRNGSEAKLVVKEMGPYVYSQQLERGNISLNGDKLSYTERRHLFHLRDDESVGSESDLIAVPNLLLLDLINLIIDMNPSYLVSFAFNVLIKNLDHNEEFLKLPVRKFLWGYSDSLMDLTSSVLPMLPRGDHFSFLNNATVSKKFTINTGEVNAARRGLIEMFDGQPNLNICNGQESDKNSRLKASDGLIFPPSMLDKNQTLYVFYPKLCRPLPFVYEKDVKVNGINSYRYRIPQDLFDDATSNAGNQCYFDVPCRPREDNVTAYNCAFFVMISLPHFHLGEKRHTEDIVGLRPDAALHDSYIDIHPSLGIALQGRVSYQINARVTKHSMIEANRYLPEGIILPVAWIETVWGDICNNCKPSD